jgi:beta-mannosidase
MLSHQKHPNGNSKIKQYMSNIYPVPDDFNDFIYVSQLLQAEGIRTGILAQRRAKPFCMGSLYWQLNDCWPAISWSSIDYSGQWKALHYFASQDLQNILISSYITNDSLEVCVVSDSLNSFPAEIQMKLMDFNGHIAEEWKLDFAMNPNSSQIIFKTDLQEILSDESSNNHFLSMELISGGKMLATRTVFFEKPKDLKLESPQLDFTVKKINTGYEITITSKNLIKNLFLELPFDGFFTENFFDVIPGIPKKVLFESKNRNIDITNKLKYNSLNTVLAKSNP